MKIYLLLLIVLFCMVAHTGFAQPLCGFDVLHNKRMKEDPAYRKSINDNEASIKEYINKHPANLTAGLRGSSVNATLYIIPVVVHVIHTGGAVGSVYNPSTAQITGAINYLNNVYNGTYPGTQGVGDLQVQFVLATRDTNCNSFSGIDRIDGSVLPNYAANGVNSGSTGSGVHDTILKNFDRWDPVNFYNIWIVNKIDGNDGTAGQFIAGYAYFAGSPPLYDGTVMLATQMLSGQKTLPHELGHALSLYHPFQGSSGATVCPANANCSSDGDMVCDTDPITYNISGGVVDFSCRSGTNTCTGTAYSPNTENNYMNYTSCYTLFTAGQKARMQAAMSLPSRQSLVNSSASGAYPAPYVNPTPACSSVTSATGLSNNYAGIMNVSLSNKSFATSTARIDGGYVNKTIKCLNLIQLQSNSTYTFSASVLAANPEQLRVWIDYNNDGMFDNTTEQIYFNANIPVPGGGVYASVSQSFTVPTTAVTGTVLRMRVIDELTTAYGTGVLSNGCFNSTYGQAEDYPVYVSLAALPVRLDFFSGIRKNNDAQLSWKTSFEENAKEFQVEKATDGFTFSSIGTVVAANALNGALYSFVDKNITSSTNYYRLRQIDKDGKAVLSQVAIIHAGNDKIPECRIINNPFEEELNIVFTGITTANSTISLFDITGRKLFSRDYKIADGEIEHINLSGARLTPGAYILQAEIESKVITRKVIKQ